METIYEFWWLLLEQNVIQKIIGIEFSFLRNPISIIKNHKTTFYLFL
tara:strand:+ start:1791 stop:1931 length:141 start_codon:yes stop_codon:yes gene_type:complete